MAQGDPPFNPIANALTPTPTPGTVNQTPDNPMDFVKKALGDEPKQQASQPNDNGLVDLTADQVRELKNQEPEPGRANLGKQNYYDGFFNGVNAGFKQLGSGLTELYANAQPYLGLGSANPAMVAGSADYLAGNKNGVVGQEKERLQQKADEIRASAPQGDGFAYQLGTFIPQALGIVAATATAPLTAGTSLSAIPAMLSGVTMATLVGSSMGEAMNTYDDYMVNSGGESNEAALWGVGLAAGGAEYFAERLGSFNRFLPKGAIAKATTKIFAKGGDEYAQSMFKQLAKSDEFTKLVGKYGWNAVKHAGEEGFEEVATELGNIAIEYAYKGMEDGPGMAEIKDRVTGAFEGGALMGGLISPVSTWSKNTMVQKARQQRGYVAIAKDDKGNAYEVVDQSDNGYTVIDAKGNQITMPEETIDQIHRFGVNDFNKMLALAKQGKEVTIEMQADAELNLEKDRIKATVQQRRYAGADQFEFLNPSGQKETGAPAIVTALKADGSKWQILSGSVNTPNPGQPMIGINLETGERAMISHNDVSNIDIVSSAQMETDLTQEAQIRMHNKANAAKGIEQASQYGPGDAVTFNGLQGEVMNAEDPTQGVQLKVTDGQGKEQYVTVPPEELGLIQPGSNSEIPNSQLNSPEKPDSSPATPEQINAAQPQQTMTVGKKQLPYEQQEDGSFYIPFTDGKDETKAIAAEVDETQFDVVPITEEVPIADAPAFAKRKSNTVVKGVKIVPKTVNTTTNEQGQQEQTQAYNAEGLGDVQTDATTPEETQTAEDRREEPNQDTQAQAEQPVTQTDIITPASPTTANADTQVAGAVSPKAEKNARPETAGQRLEQIITNDVIAQEEAKVNTEPTEAQAKAGNYKMGHVTVQGFDISIENPKGSTRSGTDSKGNKWSIEMQNSYGYFKGTKGYDGDQIDVFLGENPLSEKIFVVDQVNQDTGDFDESKCLLGFDNAEQAKAAYMSNYSKDWKGFSAITETSVEDFKEWLYDGAKQRKPYNEYKDTPEAESSVNLPKTDENPNETDGEGQVKLLKTEKPYLPESTKEDWLNYINNISDRSQVSYADFIRAVDGEFLPEDNNADQNRVITYTLNGEVIAKYDVPSEPNSRPLRAAFYKWQEQQTAQPTPQFAGEKLEQVLNQELSEIQEVAGQYGWKAEKTAKGYDLFNRKGNLTAQITYKKSRYTISFPNGQRIMSGGGKLSESIDKLLKDYFYAEKKGDDGVRFSIKPNNHKQNQFEIIQKSNPMLDDIHTGIRSADQIKTAEEAFEESLRDNEGATPDFAVSDIQKAIETGEITVYSSYPIKQGVFVSPSKMQAQAYAGEGRVYSKQVKLTDVAWIDQFEGQYANVTDPRFRSQYFYSPTEKALSEIRQEKGAVAQFKAMLLKNGSKQAEMDWMGFDDHFPDAGKTITKADIQSWIDSNKIELEEVVKGDISNSNNRFTNIPHDEHVRIIQYIIDNKNSGNIEVVKNRHGLYNIYDRTYSPVPLLKDIAKEETANDITNNPESYIDSQPTKYTQYKTPGGSDYKEWLLTMPSKKESPISIEQFLLNKGIDPYSTEGMDVINGNKNNPLYIEYNSRYGNGYSQLDTFKSSHWSEPNVVVHARTQEFTDTEGKRVLMIEEFQSDWAQQGRKKGFNTLTEQRRQNLEARKIELQKIGLENKERGIETPDEVKQEWVDVMNELQPEKRGNMIPNTPFKQTDQWLGLAMRRLVQYAADNGFDRIAWTTGEQQAERYDLSREVDNITTRKDENGNYTVQGDKDGKETFDKSGVSESELEGLIGKELASKVIEQHKIDADWYTFNGLDLQVGGSGMKGFYDKIIPAWITKNWKRFGIAVTTTHLDVKPEITEEGINTDSGDIDQSFTDDKFIEVHSIELTPELMQVAQEPQPMFRKEDNILDYYVQKADTQKEYADKARELGRKYNVPIRVVTNRNQLPIHIYTRMRNNRVYPGVFDTRTGEVFVLVNEVQDLNEVELTITHEIVAHKGLRELLGNDQFDQLCDDVYYSMHNADINNISELYNTSDRKIIADEYMAQLAETGKFPNWFDRVIATVRNMLRSAGMKARYSDADIMYLLWESRRRLTKQGTAGYIDYKANELDVVANVRFSVSVFHGSPYDFDTFSTEKIGTGEGAQAYGWGLYFTDKKGVADDYAKNLSQSSDHTGVYVDGILVTQRQLSGVRNNGVLRASLQSISQLASDESVKNSIDELKEGLENASKEYKGLYEDAIKYFETHEIKPYMPSRNVYKVNLHSDKNPDQYDYLRWDKAVTKKQWFKITKQADKENLFFHGHEIGFRRPDSDLWKSGDSVYYAISVAFKEEENSDKAASQFLLRAGIDGIQYPAEYLSKGTHEDAFNYVVFDENAVQIEEHVRYSTKSIPLEEKEGMKEIDDETLKIITTPDDPRIKEWEESEYYFRGISELKNIPELLKERSVEIDPSGYLDGKRYEFDEAKNNGYSWAEELTFEQFVNNELENEGVSYEYDDDKKTLTAYGVNAIDIYDKVFNYDASPNANFVIVFSGIDKGENLAQDGSIVVPKNIVAIVDVNNSINKGKSDNYKPINNSSIRFRISPDNKPRMLTDKGDKFREFIQDKMLSVRKLQELVQERGGSVPQTADTYSAENRASSRSKAQIEDYNNTEQDNLLNTLVKLGKPIPEINLYLKAKSSLERNDNEGTMAISEDKDDEWNRQNVTKIITDFEASFAQELVNELWANIKACTDFAITKLYLGNVISKDAYNGMKKRKFYVPLKNWQTLNSENPEDYYDYITGADRTAYQGLKKAHGRSSEADDPLAYIQAAAHSAVATANKNMVKHKALMLVRLNHEMTDLFNLNRVYLMEKGEKDDEGKPIYYNVIKGEKGNAMRIARFDAAGNPVLVSEGDFEQLYNDRIIFTKVTREHSSRRPSYLARQHEVKVYENGDLYVVSFGDPRVANALNNYEMPWLETATRIAQNTIGVFNRWLTANFTAKNPAFIPVNWIKDTGYASASHSIKDDGELKAFTEAYPKCVQAIHRYLSDKADKVNNEYDKLYQAFREFGGETGYVHLIDIKTLKSDIEREVNRRKGIKKGWDQVSQRKAIKHAGELLNYMALMSENSSRFATFVASVKAGKSYEQAATEAKNITVNFNRKGRLSGLFGSFYGFFNATVQGGHNFAYMAKHHGKNMAIATGTFYLAAVMLAELMRSVGPEDEEGNKQYDKLPLWVRQTCLTIPTFWNDNFITIPLPPGFRSIWAMGITTSDMIHGKSTAGEATFDMISSITEMFSPFAINDVEIRQGKLPIRPIVPTTLMPIYDALKNEDFTGRKIYYTPYTKDLERYTPKTEWAPQNVNGAFLKAAELWNKVGGGNENRPAGFNKQGEHNGLRDMVFNLNPAVMEHTAEYYLGGRGKFFNELYKTVRDAADPKKEVQSYNIPVIKRLYTKPYEGNVWEDYREIGQQVKDFDYFMKSARKTGDIEQVSNMIDRQDMLTISAMYKKYSKAVQAYSDAIPYISNPEEAKELRKGRELLIKDFMQRVTQVKENRKDDEPTIITTTDK